MFDTVNCGVRRCEAEITLEEVRDCLTEGLSDLKPSACTDVAAWIRSTTLDRAQRVELRWFLNNFKIITSRLQPPKKVMLIFHAVIPL